MHAVDAASRIGNPVEPLTTAAKLDWLRAQRPETFASAAMFHAGAKDYLAWRLTGVHATNPTAASNTGLMDLETRSWDAPVLADIAGMAVAVHANPVGATALGAAILGGRALGWELRPPPHGRRSCSSATSPPAISYAKTLPNEGSFSYSEIP